MSDGEIPTIGGFHRRGYYRPLQEDEVNFSTTLKGLRTSATALSAVVALASCGGGSGDGMGAANPQQTGAVRFALTDAPACGFDAVNITVDRVRVHADAAADTASSGWQDLVVSPARRVNLLDLSNGVLQELGQVALPAGRYTQVRLVLLPNGGGALSNSIVPAGGIEVALATPSAAQSGIKLIHPFTVPAGGLADLVLDFDACKSIVRRGNGTFGLKPVVAVVPRTVAEIVGSVDPSIDGARISAQVNGVVLRTTVADAAGAFRLPYLDPAVAAAVDVVVVAPGRATAVISAVPLMLQGATRVSTSADPIVLPASPARTASGTVTPATAAATLRALQAVGALARVEVASTNADDTGAYSLTLPTGAPLLAPYSTMLPLVFAAQPANAAKYSIAAQADAFLAQSTNIDLGAANAVADFTLSPAP
jgi:Domain of unknown function (DUF4382)